MKLIDLHEMEIQEFRHLMSELNKILLGYNLKLATTTHGIQRMFLDQSADRRGIDINDFISTIQSFLSKEYKKLDVFRQKKEKYKASISNKRNGLNIVVAIDYDRPPNNIALQTGIRKIYDLNIITAIVKKDFKSDNFSSNKVIIENRK